MLESEVKRWPRPLEPAAVITRAGITDHFPRPCQSQRGDSDQTDSRDMGFCDQNILLTIFSKLLAFDI